MRHLFCLLFAVALPAQLLAEPVSFEEAIALASRQSPALRSRTFEIDARRSAALAAGQLPDPKLGVGIDNFPISGPPAFTFSGDNMTMARVSVSQEIPNGAKRHARVGRALADVGEAGAMLSVEQRRTRVEAAIAWIALDYAERRLDAVERELTAIGRLKSSAIAGVASGTARPAQALAVQRALLALQDKRSEVGAEIGKSRALLSRWTGVEDPQPQGSGPQAEVNAAALRNNIDAIPSLDLLLARQRQAEADIALARADKKPDFGVDLAYQRRARRYGDMVSAGVTVGLPLFARRRQDPIIAARIATASAAQAGIDDARRSLLAELESDLADHVMHHEQWMRARQALLPLARQRVDLETASYGARRASLVDVIEARTALADSALEVLDREAAVMRDSVRLSLTYGSDRR